MAAITKNRDILRLEIGDTDTDNFLFTDLELDVFLVRHGLTGTGTGAELSDLLSAAADACLSLARRFAREFDFSEDGQSFSRSQRSALYLMQAKELRRRAGGTGYSVVVTSSVTAAAQTS